MQSNEMTDMAVKQGDECAKNGDLAGAIANYSQALAIYPWCGRAYDKLGDLLDSHSKDKVVEAITSLEEEKYLKVIEYCKNKTTLLGAYFWRNRIPLTTCRLEKGRLNKLLNRSLSLFN